jgi:hypothetical protein
MRTEKTYNRHNRYSKHPQFPSEAMYRAPEEPKKLGNLARGLIAVVALIPEGVLLYATMSGNPGLAGVALIGLPFTAGAEMAIANID